MREFPALRTLQESVVMKFAANWFRISETDAENQARWDTCDQATCASDEYTARADGMCALSCAASNDLFVRFVQDVAPDYTMRMAAGETWVLDINTLNVIPDGPITTDGGLWRISGQIISNLVGRIDVLAFATVGRNQNAYPTTLGFYVQDFNAYRTSK